MRKPFKVLDRETGLHQHYLLEASAGTGKTFSIQNIVVRLLIEPHAKKEPLQIQKMLIVTFTKAAAQELKIRIRKNIEQALHYFESWLIEESNSIQAPDYIRAYFEKGESAVQQAKKKLQHALFTFDQAHIFTIHSFCARMLHQFAIEGDITLRSHLDDPSLLHSERMAIIRDFFRTEIRHESYSPAQIEILLKKDPDQRKLWKLIQTGYSFPCFATYEELYKQFSKQMLFLKEQFSLTSRKMIEDFQAQASLYRNYKKSETKTETLAKVTYFAQLFDQSDWNQDNLDQLLLDDLVWTQALDDQLLKTKNSSLEKLHYLQLTQQLNHTLYPLIEEGRNGSILLARMARDCQKFLQRYQQEEEIFSPDDLLRKMNRALHDSSFLKGIQDNFQAIIIDEFQDTDPIQWEIFRCLFEKWDGYLYLVGDPKQSIYSFRQADIYTYLTAARMLGDSHCYSLNVNYRSQPHLVQALNLLFDSNYLPNFIPLPKLSTYLSYHPVDFSDQNEIFADEKGAIHFFIANGHSAKKAKLSDLEEAVFFPFIAQEMERLRKEKKLALNQFAVLVRDRYQAMRLIDFFERHKISYVNQRGTTLADSTALQPLIHLLNALFHPRDRGAARTVLGGPLFGWTNEELCEKESLESISQMILRLRESLFKKGFATFFQELLNIVCKPDGPTVREQILMREKGLEFYRDLLQISDLVVQYQYREWNQPEELIFFLDQFPIWEQNEDERIKRFKEATTKGVKVLTLHFCKGLEFEIVFALGLVNRIEMKDDLIPIESENGELLLSPLAMNSKEYQKHCEEIDAEKMRQLYVAFTRAKMQLYLPVALHLSSENIKQGDASPMDLFLARFNQSSTSYQNLYERIRTCSGQSLLDFLEKKGKENFITYSIHQKIFYESKKQELENTLELIPPPKVTLADKSIWIYSFSTMKQSILEVRENLPHHFKNSVKNVHTLPANRETGLLIHHILEKIHFHALRELKESDQIIPMIRPFVQQTNFHEWENAIADLVFDTLKTSLPQISDHFSLSSLELTQLYREIPFMFSFNEGDKIEEIQYDKGLLKGVIDLLFYHNGLYYLVDWKTNWLGTDSDAYQVTSLKKAMEENDYILQASIYTEAIKRYLSIVESRPFEECFGGAFYLFLRGIKMDQSEGIFHFFPNGSVPMVST